MHKILRLEVSNLLRVKAAEVTPAGAVVIVGGKNDQGKTSLLNCIAMALSGKDLPARPIRDGASKGHVILQTDEITVTRKFSMSGASTLEVRDAEGRPVTSPQAKLDALTSRVSFDPFEFTRMKPGDQLNTVRRIVGLDFTALDAEAAKVYSDRTEINRQAKEKNALLANIPRDPTAVSVDVEELAEKVRAAQVTNATNADQRKALGKSNDYIDDLTGDNAKLEAEIFRLQEVIREKREELTEGCERLARSIGECDELKAHLATLVDIDTAPLLAQISSSQAINQRVANTQKWNETHRAKVALESKAADLTARLEAIAGEKEKTLAAAKFPVTGLGFSDEGVTYNGLPFEQAGTAVKIRTSVAIARALNPALPVMLVRDGALLDDDSLALLTAEAEAGGIQCWLEVVGNRDDATVIIEDGEVIATPAADKKKAKAK